MSNHKHTVETLGPAVETSISWAEVCRKVGVKPFTGAQSHLKKRAIEMGLDFTHFLGQASNRGRTFTRTQKPLEFYLTQNSTGKSYKIRTRLIAEGYKEEKCEICGLTEWLDGPPPLELDHKNSDHWDYRLENLQIICPNCHAVETTERRK